MILRGMSRVSTPGHFWDIIWGMSGASSGACLGIIWGISGHHLGHYLKACLGQSKISAVLHASLMPFGSSGGVIVVVVAMVVVVLYSGGGSTLASRSPPVSMLALWALWVQNYFTALFS